MKLFSVSHNSTKVQKAALSFLFSGMGFSSESADFFFFFLFSRHVFVLLAQKRMNSVYLTVVNVAPEQDEQ